MISADEIVLDQGRHPPGDAALRKSLLFIVILLERWFGDEAFLSLDSLVLPSGRNWKALYYTPINRFRVKQEMSEARGNR